MSERRKILVTGASSGIGKATAVRFASEGWDVCLNARREKELQQVHDGLAAGDHLVCAGDYSDPTTAEAIYQAVSGRWGRLDVLVNCAGVSWPVDAVASPLEQWRKPFDIMLMGAVSMTRVAVRLMTANPSSETAGPLAGQFLMPGAALRLRSGQAPRRVKTAHHQDAKTQRTQGIIEEALCPSCLGAFVVNGRLSEQGGGRIIHVTSIHGERGERMQSSYGMVKAALNQYCRALAIELAPRGILVNAIAPGFVDTPMSIVDGVSELETEWFKAHYVDGHHLPLRRAGRPEEIAGVAWFLAGPDASYITGQVLTVDGGLTITF